MIDVGLAQAQTPIPTDTPDWQPLFPTSTPAPTQEYHCPDGQPDGWGTVTPDSYWWLQCSNCVVPATSTPLPTSTPDPQQTWTPTPEQTATPIGTDQYFFVDKRLDPNGSFNSTKPDNSCTWYLWCYEYISPDFNLDCGAGNTIVGWAFSSDGWMDYAGANFYPRDTGAGIYALSNTTGVMARFDYDYLEQEGNQALMDTYLYQMGYPSLEFVDIVNQVGGAWWVGNITTRSKVNARGDNEHNIDFQLLGVLCYGQIPQIPTPTLRPSYCDSVDDGGMSGGELESWLPQILVAQGSCVEILGWELDVSVLNLIPGIEDLDTVSFPGFQLCVNPIQFGNVNLFGVTVDLDVIAFAMAGLVIIRILLRS